MYDANPLRMPTSVNISNRDVALLRFLNITPATAAHVRKASVTFEGESFRDERRVRERLQVLGDAGLVKSWPAAVSGGGLMSYYRLSGIADSFARSARLGYQALPLHPPLRNEEQSLRT